MKPVNMKRQYRRNIAALATHLIFAKRITAPIMMPFYLSLGLNYTQIGALSSVTKLTDGSLEIVGGAFSDVYGRRRTSLLYASLGMLMMLILARGHGFAALVLASVIHGLALAIGSGNVSALLYDTLLALGLEDQYKKYRGRIQFPPKVINSMLLLIVPIIFRYNVRWPFWLGFGLYTFALLTALLITEPPRAKSSTQSMTETIKSTWRELSSSRPLRRFIWRQSVVTSLIALVVEYYQPLFALAGVPLAATGILYAFVRIINGYGSLTLHRLGRHSDHRVLRWLSSILMLVFIMIGFGHGWWIIALSLVVSWLDGAVDVLTGDMLNKQISSQNRTTIVSAANSVAGLVMSAVLLLAGWLSDRWGIQVMFSVMVSLSLISGIFLDNSDQKQ